MKISGDFDEFLEISMHATQYSRTMARMFILIEQNHSFRFIDLYYYLYPASLPPLLILTSTDPSTNQPPSTTPSITHPLKCPFKIFRLIKIKMEVKVGIFYYLQTTNDIIFKWISVYISIILPCLPFYNQYLIFTIYHHLSAIYNLKLSSIYAL